MNKLSRHAGVGILACALLPAAACAAESSMQDWIGKYPSDELVPHRGDLLHQARLRDGLRALIPRPEMALLEKFDAEAPVRQIGHYLVIDKCRPHDCPAESAMIVVDLDSDRLWAAFFSRTSSRIATRWYGNKDDFNAVPEQIRTEFLKQHGSIPP